MDKLKYVKLENEDGSYSDSIPLAVDGNYVDINGNTLTEELNNKTDKITTINLQNQIDSLASGSPLVANSISEMIDTTRIYVNTTDGHWYWYNGTTWIDGGLYQSTGIGNNTIEYSMFNNDMQSNIKNILNGNEIEIIDTINFEIGSIVSGSEQASNTRIRSDYIDISNSTYLHLKVATGYKYGISFYLDDKTYISNTLGSYYPPLQSSWSTDEKYIIIKPQIKYARIIIADTSDSTNISVSKKNNVNCMKSYLIKDNIHDNDLLVKPFIEWLKNNNYIFNNNIYSNGSVSATNAELTSSSTRIISNLIDVSDIDGYLKLSTLTGYKCSYIFFDSSFNKLIQKYWATSYSVKIPNNAKYLIVQVAKNNDTSIVPNEGNNVTIEFSISPPLQKIENIIDDENIDLGWEYGSLNESTGQPSGSSIQRIRSDYIYVGKGTRLELDDSTVEHIVYTYDLTKTYISHGSWISTPIEVESDCYIRLILKKSVSADISQEEFNIIVGKENIYRTFPQSMISTNIDDDIPSYFVNNINTVINNATTNIFNSGINSDSFIFISDVHWQNNSKHSPALIKNIINQTNVNKIICGGDLIGGGEKAEMIELMTDCVNSYKNIAKFYSLFGNHDSNHIGAPSSSDYFSKAEAYTLMQKQEDFNMNYGKPCYFYFDNPTTKTRYICLDTGEEGTLLDSNQSSWLTSTLNSMPSGYHGLIFLHIVCALTDGNTWHIGLTPEELVFTSFMNDVINILDTFNLNHNDKKVEAIFGGHVHIDCNFETSGGIPIVMIDCDALQTLTETTSGSGVRNATVGTITEQCFDVVTIDYENKIIKCSRIGRGNDRVISY